MRDPEGEVHLEGRRVLRKLVDRLPPEHVLRSGTAHRWVEEGRLIPFEWQDDHCLNSPKIPFVSAPYEWCDAQFFDAASLTLDLLESANEAGTDLKDASAWNVLFDGCRPIFCDLTSFTPLHSRKWWAAGQFSRHFISPLWLSRETGLRAKDSFLLSRDGAQPDFVRETLGVRRYLSRRWPTVASSKENPATSENSAADGRIENYRTRLIATLRWMIADFKSVNTRASTWSGYRDTRDHYSTEDLGTKKAQVAQWLNQLRPAWTLDLGCNDGEFSAMALDVNSKVIALDGDHDAIQTLYSTQRHNRNIYPVLATLDDVSSGRGWNGTEHPGLLARLEKSADAVLMLALIHHLYIAASIPIQKIADLAASCTRRWLIVEMLAPSDPQVKLISASRHRSAEEFELDAQRASFNSAGFKIRHEVFLPSKHRILALLERTS